MMEDGGASPMAAWGGAFGHRLVGFLDGDGSQSGLGATRPALWTRARFHRQTVWSLTVLPVPAGFVGFSLGNGNSRGVLIGWGSADDGTVRAGYATRTRR